MADETPKIGVQAVLEADEFQQALAKYNASLAAASTNTDQFAKIIQDAGTAWTAAAKHTKAAADESKGFSSVITGAVMGAVSGLVSGGLTLLGNALGTVKDMAIGATTALFDLGVQATMGTARGQELGIAAQYFGQRMGMSAQQVDTLKESLIAAGATDDTAGQAIALLSQRQLDATQAAKLWNIAQAASVTQGGNVQEMYLGLIDAISMGRTKALEAAGITVDSEQAYAAYAKQLGITKDQLNEVQQRQALMNMAIAQGADAQQLYDAAMQKPLAQWRNITDTLVPKLMDAFGEPFQLAFGGATSALTRMVESLTKAVSEGGVLYPLMVELGAVASIAADAFGVFGDTLTSVGEAGAGPFVDMVSSAFEWGANTIGQFAAGIIEGVGTSLVWAMEQASGMLSWFLAPGSPPRVAPDIDKWGTAALGEWLHGFAMADFGAIEAIQKPLQTALGLVIGSGTGSREKIGGAFAGLSKQIMGAIGERGLSDALFRKIAGATGEYGQEIATLAREQVDLAVASNDAAEAQERLNAAQKAAADANGRVNTLTREYNAMLRTGASKEALAAKLAEIRAEEQKRRQAQQAAKDAQKDVDASKDKVDLLKKQADLQAKLVDQLLSLAKATEPGKEAAPRAGGGARVPMPTLAGPAGGYKFDLASPMDEAIKKVKAAIQAKISKALAPILAAWENVKKKVTTAWETLQKKWGEFTAAVTKEAQRIADGVADAWEELKKWTADTWDSITEGIDDNLDNMSRNTQQGISNIKSWLEARWGEINSTASSKWEEFKVTITTKVTDAYNGVIRWIGDTKTWLDGKWREISGAVTTTWDGIKSAVSEKVLGVYNDITGTIGAALGWITGKVEEWKQAGSKLIGGLSNGVWMWLQGIYDDVTRIVGAALGWITGKVNDWKTAGAQLIGQLSNGIWTYLNTIYNDITGKVGGTLKWITDQAGQWYNAGKSLIDNIISGIMSRFGWGSNNLSTTIQRGVQGAINDVLGSLGLPGIFSTSSAQGASGAYGAVAQPMALMPQMASPVGATNHYYFGGNTIAGDMDMALFEARVLAVLERR